MSAAVVATLTFLAAPAASAAEPGCESAKPLLDGACEHRPEAYEGVDHLKKTADRDIYAPGDTITFTIEISANADGIENDNFDVFDLMDDVLDDADYNDDATASTGMAELQDKNGSQVLRWQGDLDPGESATLTFSVTATAEGDGQIANRALYAAHSADPPCAFVRTSSSLRPGKADIDDLEEQCAVTVRPEAGGDGEADVVAAPAADDGSTLPITGANLGTILAVAACLVTAGAVLLLVTRRRRTAE